MHVCVLCSHYHRVHRSREILIGYDAIGSRQRFVHDNRNSDPMAQVQVHAGRCVVKTLQSDAFERRQPRPLTAVPCT